MNLGACSQQFGCVKNESKVTIVTVGAARVFWVRVVDPCPCYYVMDNYTKTKSYTNLIADNYSNSVTTMDMHKVQEDPFVDSQLCFL